jgi:pimeloyl-ACP methyl ester carboxylesterase
MIARFALLALLLGLWNCGARVTTALSRLQPCSAEDGPSGAYCGAYEVFENRAAKEGRKIGLKIVLLPALDNDPSPDPMFFLAGGPGQAATSLAYPLANLFSRVRRHRDIVLVDQRGTGKDNPLLCKDAWDDEDQTRDPFDISAGLAKLRECLENFEGNPTLYTTPAAMDDLDEIRMWLGYDRINLYGGSYGTRAVLVYMRQHPESIRATVLDGVAPPDMGMPLRMPQDSQRALDKLVEACSIDPLCRQQFPDFGEKLQAVLEKLNRERPKVRLRHPRTGEPVEWTLPAEAVRMPLMGALYSPWESSLIPLVIEEASKGNYEPLLALALAKEGSAGEMSQGMFYSIVCSEDDPLVKESDVEAASANTFLGSSLLNTRWKPCEFWPKAAVPREYYEPVASDAPVLILSGDLDPVTPPHWGEAVAKSLPNSRHLVAPAAGHGVLTNGCAMRLIEEFFQTADASGLDAGCLEDVERPPFFIQPSGPRSAPSGEGS